MKLTTVTDPVAHWRYPPPLNMYRGGVTLRHGGILYISLLLSLLLAVSLSWSISSSFSLCIIIVIIIVVVIYLFLTHRPQNKCRKGGWGGGPLGVEWPGMKWCDTTCPALFNWRPFSFNLYSDRLLMDVPTWFMKGAAPHRARFWQKPQKLENI